MLRFGSFAQTHAPHGKSVTPLPATSAPNIRDLPPNIRDLRHPKSVTYSPQIHTIESRTSGRASLCAKGRGMLRRFAKWFGLILGAALALLALLLVVLQQPGRDSLAALPRGGGPATTISHQAMHKDGRLIQQYTIEDTALGRIGLVVGCCGCAGGPETAGGPSRRRRCGMLTFFP